MYTYDNAFDGEDYVEVVVFLEPQAKMRVRRFKHHNQLLADKAIKAFIAEMVDCLSKEISGVSYIGFQKQEIFMISYELLGPRKIKIIDIVILDDTDVIEDDYFRFERNGTVLIVPTHKNGGNGCDISDEGIFNFVTKNAPPCLKSNLASAAASIIGTAIVKHGSDLPLVFRAPFGIGSSLPTCCGLALADDLLRLSISSQVSFTPTSTARIQYLFRLAPVILSPLATTATADRGIWADIIWPPILVGCAARPIMASLSEGSSCEPRGWAVLRNMRSRRASGTLTLNSGDILNSKDTLPNSELVYISIGANSLNLPCLQ